MRSWESARPLWGKDPETTHSTPCPQEPSHCAQPRGPHERAAGPALRQDLCSGPSPQRPPKEAHIPALEHEPGPWLPWGDSRVREGGARLRQGLPGQGMDGRAFSLLSKLTRWRCHGHRAPRDRTLTPRLVLANGRRLPARHGQQPHNAKLLSAAPRRGGQTDGAASCFLAQKRTHAQSQHQGHGP